VHVFISFLTNWDRFGQCVNSIIRIQECYKLFYMSFTKRIALLIRVSGRLMSSGRHSGKYFFLQSQPPAWAISMATESKCRIQNCSIRKGHPRTLDSVQIDPATSRQRRLCCLRGSYQPTIPKIYELSPHLSLVYLTSIHQQQTAIEFEALA